MNNKELYDEAFERILKEILENDTLDKHDIDNLLKAMAVYANIQRNETDVYKADKEAEASKYSANVRSNAERFSAQMKAEADREVAKMKADIDERAYERQFWGNVISGGLKLTEGIISVAAIIMMFNSGLKFEETGVFSSKVMGNLLTNLRIKR